MGGPAACRLRQAVQRARASKTLCGADLRLSCLPCPEADCATAHATRIAQRTADPGRQHHARSAGVHVGTRDFGKPGPYSRGDLVWTGQPGLRLQHSRRAEVATITLLSQVAW